MALSVPKKVLKLMQNQRVIAPLVHLFCAAAQILIGNFGTEARRDVSHRVLLLQGDPHLQPRPANTRCIGSRLNRHSGCPRLIPVELRRDSDSVLCCVVRPPPGSLHIAQHLLDTARGIRVGGVDQQTLGAFLIETLLEIERSEILLDSLTHV